MERTKWTDEMLDQRFAAMDEKSDLFFSELRLLRQEMNGGFAAIRGEMNGGFAAIRGEMNGIRGEMNGIRGEMNGIRDEMNAGLAAVRQEMAVMRSEMISFHRQSLYVVVTLWVGLLGLLATQL